MQRCRSCGVSLPSLPSLLVKSSFFGVVGLVVLPRFCFGVTGGFGVPLVVKPEAAVKLSCKELNKQDD